MIGDSEQPSEFRNVREAHAAFVREQQEDENVTLETFCDRHPEMADDLKKLDAGYRLGQAAKHSRSFHQSIREHFGDVPEITISLTPDGNAEVSAEISAESSAGSASRSPADPRAPTITGGENFGRYNVEDEVARGGMGAIYRVKDRDLSRTLAMKVMLDAPADTASSPDVTRANLARFVEEAQVTAQLDHPGIVPVHELGFDAQGSVYFTMKLVKGRELGEIFALARDEKDGWNLPRAVGVVVKACQALAYAHAKQVVHRDLKPANIMAGRFGEVYVMDWGLAKIAGKKDLHDIRLQHSAEMTYTSIRSDRKASAETSAESPLVTMDGSVVGTPAYMPPEQAAGQVEQVDPSSDIYSLGAILYNLLTGQAPYVEPGMRISPHTILARVLDGPPKRIHELNPQASPELTAICEMAMARKKKHRYPSSLEMAEDLQAHLDHRVVRAYRTGAVAEFKSWVTRNRGMAASAAAALVLALCGLVVLFWVELEAKREIQGERDIALVAKESEERAKTLAQDALRQVTAERDLKNTALEQKTAALGEKDRALARAEGLFLTGKASQEVTTNPGRALLLAVEGVERQGETASLSNKALLDALAADRELRVLAGSGQPVSEVAYSPDSELIATVQGGAVRLWDAASGEPVALLLDPGGSTLQNVRFSPDGRRLAATSLNPARVPVFEVASRRLLFLLEDHLSSAATMSLQSVAFSPDGTKMVTASLDGTARVYDASTGISISVFKGHRCGVRSATFSPDSTRVLTASSGQIYEFLSNGYRSSGVALAHARVWDAGTGDEVLRIGGHRSAVTVAAFSPDGKRIVTGSRFKLELHDAANGESASFPVRPGKISNALWSPDGDLITLNSDGFLRRWSSDPVEEIWSTAIPHVPEGRLPPAPRFSPDGRLIALLEDGTSIGLRDSRSGLLLETLRGHLGPVTCLTFSPDGSRLISGSDDGTIRVWDTDTETRFGDLRPVARYGNARKVIFSPGGHRVLVVDRDDRASVTDRASGREVNQLTRPPRGGLKLFEREVFESAYFRPGGKEVATVARSGALRFWDTGKGDSRKTSLVSVLARDIDFDPTGDYVAVLGLGGAVHLLGHGNFRDLKKLGETGAPFGRPRFSPDGKTLLAVGSDASARLWAVPSGEERGRVDLKGILPQQTTSLQSPPDTIFDPTGKGWLLSLKGGLVMLDMASGSKIAELTGKWSDIADHVEFAPDGKSILVVAEGQTLVTGSDLAADPRDIGEPETVYVGATFSHEGDRIAALTSDGKVEIRKGPAGGLLFRLAEPSRIVRSVAFSPGSANRRLVTGSMEGKLDLWALSDGRHIQSFGEHPREVAMVSFSPDGRAVLSVSDGFAHLWWAESGKQIRTLARSEFSLRTGAERWASGGSTEYAFSKDGRRFLMFLPARATTAVWDIESGELLLQHRREETSLRSATLGPTGEYLFLAQWNWKWARSQSRVSTHKPLRATITVSRANLSPLQMVEVESGRIVRNFRPLRSSRGLTISPSVRWSKIAVSSDGRLLAAMTGSVLAVWEIASNAELFRSRAYGSLLEFSPDGQRLMYGDGREIFMWNSETDEVSNFPEIPPNVRSLTFSPDGRSFLTTGEGSDVRMWFRDTSTTFRGHQGPVTSGVFSPDGRWVATASEDRTVRLWSVETGSQWLTLPHTGKVVSLLFSSDGHEILTVTADQKPHAWPVDLLALAKAELRRPLTADERTLFQIGSVEDREKMRRDESITRICGTLRLLAAALLRDPANPKGLVECDRLFKELSGVIPGVSSDSGDEASGVFAEIDRTLRVYQDGGINSPAAIEFQADLLATRGDVPGAVRILERAARSRFARTEFETRLESLRDRLLPDLATLASIDAALDTRETLVAEGATWRYLEGTREPSAGLEWTKVEFDDADWESGPSGFGYGDEDDATILDDMRGSYSTVYIRHVFQRPDTTRFDDLALEVRADDGFVAYLNGVEVGRSRAGPTEARLPHDAHSTSTSPEPLATVSLDISVELLPETANVFALQVLNRSLSSSDLTLIPILTARLKPNYERDQKRFEAFRGAARGDDAASRIEYLKARLLERAERFADAATIFDALSRREPARAAPLLGLARCLKALRKFDEALAALKRGLATRLIRDEAIWDTWFELFLVDLERSPRNALTFLERQNLEDSPGARRPRDLRWALEQIRAGVLRINCGGQTYRSSSDVAWSEDRFSSSSGRTASPSAREIAGTEDDDLYRTEMYFPRTAKRPFGYRIPLPPDRYRITLGFAEAFLDPPRRRRFDVFLEDNEILKGYEPPLYRAETRSFERTVTDGFLDITFEHEIDNPKISTIEIEPLGR